MWATARARAGSTSSSFCGKYSHGICITSSIFVVMGPMRACCGSSWGPPGSPRSVVMTRIGMWKIALSDVRGLTALPRPEFWNIAMARTPPRSEPEAMETASPSLAAAT